MQERGSPEPIVCSVVIPAYNRAGWLPACVESARRSGVRGLEIILLTARSRACMRAAVARRAFDGGYVLWERGHLAGARRAFATSIREGGPHRQALLYWACSWLGPALVRRLRVLKWALEAKGGRAGGAVAGRLRVG